MDSHSFDSEQQSVGIRQQNQRNQSTMDPTSAEGQGHAYSESNRLIIEDYIEVGVHRV